MISQEYRTNRARFPRAELLQHQGRWVAFSADGCKLVASALTLAELEDRLAVCGETNPPVVLEWIAASEEDSLLGAEEWL